MSSQLHKSNLAGPGDRNLVISGAFRIHGSRYGVTFGRNRLGLSTFLEFFEAQGDNAETAFLHITPQGVEFPSASLRFHLDREFGVAAALMVAADRDGKEYSWMTSGKAGRDDIILVQDSSSPRDTRFPSESFITIAELREVITQWVFGDALPPPAARWVAMPDVRWF